MQGTRKGYERCTSREVPNGCSRVLKAEGDSKDALGGALRTAPQRRRRPAARDDAVHRGDLRDHFAAAFDRTGGRCEQCGRTRIGRVEDRKSAP
jgi:hypothetical protein